MKNFLLLFCLFGAPLMMRAQTFKVASIEFIDTDTAVLEYFDQKGEDLRWRANVKEGVKEQLLGKMVGLSFEGDQLAFTLLEGREKGDTTLLQKEEDGHFSEKTKYRRTDLTFEKAADGSLENVSWTIGRYRTMDEGDQDQELYQQLLGRYGEALPFSSIQLNLEPFTMPEVTATNSYLMEPSASFKEAAEDLKAYLEEQGKKAGWDELSKSRYKAAIIDHPEIVIEFAGEEPLFITAKAFGIENERFQKTKEGRYRVASAGRFLELVPSLSGEPGRNFSGLLVGKYDKLANTSGAYQALQSKYGDKPAYQVLQVGFVEE